MKKQYKLGVVLAALVGVEAGKLAEGAFLAALARETTARAQGWPVLSTLQPAVPAPKSVARAFAKNYDALADSEILMGQQFWKLRLSPR